MSRPASLHQLGTGAGIKTVNFALFSFPGVGKTVLAGSGGKTTMIMDSDLGTESAEAYGSEAYVMPVIDYDQVEEAYQFVKHDRHPFNWLWWDSGTLFLDRCLIDSITADAHAANPSKQDEDVPSQREYLKNQNRFLRYVRLFAALPINFGITFHVGVMEDKETEELVYCPAIQGKNMPSKMMGYMNVVGYLKAKRDRRRIFFQPSAISQFVVKDRFDALGPYMDEPTIPKIERAIRKNFPSVPGAGSSARAKKASGSRASKRTTSTRRK